MTSIFNIFKKKEAEAEALQHASVTLYPEKILIVTYNRAREGFWIGTNNLSIIAIDADNELLGSTIRYHMSLTQIGQLRPKDWKSAHKQFLKAAGFKSEKEEYKGAKNVGISLRGIRLTIRITINGEYNGRTRAFWGNGQLEFDNTIRPAELGQRVREAWDLCK